MDKNVVYAIVFSTLIIIAGVTIQTKFFPSASSKERAQATEKALPAPSANTTTPAPAPTPTATTTVTDSGTAPANQAATTTAATVTEEAAIPEETDVIETPLVKVTFTNHGGDIVSYKLKQHSAKNDAVEMADHVTAANRAFSLAFGDANGAPIDQPFNVKRISDTEIGFFRSFTVQNPDGTTGTFTLAKQYSFRPDDYMFELKVIIDGDSSFAGLKMGQAAYTIKTSPEIGPKWVAKHNQYEFRKYYYMMDGKKKSFAVNQGQTKTGPENLSWTGVTGKYFSLIALPESPLSSVLYSGQSARPDQTVNQIFLTRAAITGAKSTDVWRFYIGPRTDKYLAPYNVAMNNPYKLADTHIDAIVDSSGILAPLEVLLKWIMEFFYMLIPNWGVSIILLTVLTRIILFPLTKKSSESTLKMQEFQPKIQEIQQKYQNNPQKMNEEMAKFYKTAGYNPMSGCLPLLIQFPLLFAMYNLFNNYFEFRGAMFIPGWIPDLSAGDSIMAFTSALPVLNWTDLRLLPIIYVISQLLFGKVTQTPTTAQQNASMKIMVYGMPIFFFFLFYNAPSGLLLYWTFSNILTLAQQIIINRMMHAKKETGLKLVKK